MQTYEFYAELSGDAVPFMDALGIDYWNPDEFTGHDHSNGGQFQSDKSLTELLSIARKVKYRRGSPYESTHIEHSLALASDYDQKRRGL